MNEKTTETPRIYVDADAFATPAEWAALCRLIAKIASGEVKPLLG